MCIPIGDDNQGRLTTPYVVYIIVAINIAVFLIQLSDDRFTLNPQLAQTPRYLVAARVQLIVSELLSSADDCDFVRML